MRCAPGFVGASGPASSAEGAGVVVLSCGRLREAGEGGRGGMGVCFQLCTIYRGPRWKVANVARSEFSPNHNSNYVSLFNLPRTFP